MHIIDSLLIEYASKEYYIVNLEEDFLVWSNLYRLWLFDFYSEDV